MKRTVHILLAAFVLLALQGCGGSFKDIRVTDCEILSLTPIGFKSLDAVVKVTVENPTAAFTLSDIQGCVRLNGEKFVNLTADPVRIERRCTEEYTLPIKATLEEGFNPFQLLSLLKGNVLEQCTADVSANATVAKGVGKVIEKKDIPLKDLADKF